MIEILSCGTRKARKLHQCFHCYRPIPKGEVYGFSTNKYDHVYTLCYHLDCQDACDFYMKEMDVSPWDHDEGYPPLADQISDAGEFEADHNMLRGRFPHVVCRLELHEQRAAIRVGEWECPQ